MARIFCIPGIIFLLLALVLSILVTISLPSLHPFDITRVTFLSGLGTISGTPDNVSGQFRFGIWGYCYQTSTTSGFDCVHTGHGYAVTVANQQGGTETVGTSWTRGLAVHAVACVVTGIAFLLSFSEHVTVTLVSSLTAFLAALLTLIAFACDIALLTWTQHQMSQLNISEHTSPGPGFWMTLVTFILLLFAGCTVCFGHRRERYVKGGAGGEYAMGGAPWWRRQQAKVRPAAV
ncbi:hypothetical protein DACRYDRAFT_21505 [Dacryopinax primogenitus]|uniref:Pali-domain-containing protein n=1 Tax=Dacryopinax primogenitus (strain DJM 731) TaxID=1858805 RepID=M5GEI4_DACPD|nr:uncharacterized protein DACRYDRAFT_21505 [Dacryopinax primogenitus]EJU03283.1 hypothetical protein DACRYDRAFT_21505 [Dacryopinax primogenitus]